MTCTAQLRIRFESEAAAERVFLSVHADDDAFCTTRRLGAVVEADLKGDSPRSLLRSVDDFLATASVAEDVINEPDMAADDA